MTASLAGGEAAAAELRQPGRDAVRGSGRLPRAVHGPRERPGHAAPHRLGAGACCAEGRRAATVNTCGLPAAALCCTNIGLGPRMWAGLELHCWASEAGVIIECVSSNIRPTQRMNALVDKNKYSSVQTSLNSYQGQHYSQP